jgi:hypothetical protein
MRLGVCFWKKYLEGIRKMQHVEFVAFSGNVTEITLLKETDSIVDPVAHAFWKTIL